MIKHRYCLVTNMVGMFLDLMDDIVDSTTALCPATFDCPSTLKPQPLSRNYVIFSRDPRPRIHRALASSFWTILVRGLKVLCFRPLLERNCNFSRVWVVSCKILFRSSYSRREVSRKIFVIVEKIRFDVVWFNYVFEKMRYFVCRMYFDGGYNENI